MPLFIITSLMKARVSIIGAGNVGATTAHLVVQSGLADVVIFDIAEGVPEGKALDILQASSLWNVSVSVKGTSSYADTAGSDIIVITAGLPRKPGMSRDDLLHANAEVMKQVVAGTSKLSPDCIYIVVTNPMDVMTQLVQNASGVNPQRVIGMGGVLDSARFRTFISMELGVSPEDIETVVLGGHGDLMVPMPRFTTANGISIDRLISGHRLSQLIDRTRNGGAEIVSFLKTGSAYYAPAASVFRMVRSILLDEKRILPCAALLNGEYGISNTYVGVPVVLGKAGIEKIIELDLDDAESEQFRKSAGAVKELYAKTIAKN